ncbi:MAG: TonB-dependent receptor [Balneolaceae bacterium]|nr:TonB-dependent receptor [Balneolaceae bacterium]
MINKLHIILTFTFISITVLGQAQTGEIKGTVFSNTSPIPGANVGIADIQKGDASNQDGKYHIKNIPEGTYILQASAVGFKKFTKKITVEAGQVLLVEIVLKKSSYQMDEVVITGTMRETFVKESPVKVDVITTSRLQQGKTSSNIMDLVGNINGLSTQLNCGVCGTNAIRINGVEGPNTAVLIDGMPIMGALASVYGLNGISPSIIDQVEVIKGPQSTLYGTQALGGVVNIITKNPDNTPTFSADVYGRSTSQEGSIHLAASPQIGNFKGFISGNLTRNQHYFDDNNDGFNDQPKQMRIALFGKGVLEGRHGERRFSVAAKFYDETRTGGVKSFNNNLRGSNQVYGESIYTRRAELLTEYRPGGLNEQLRISTAFTYHHQDSFYGTEHYDAQQNIAFGQATWSQPIFDYLNLLAGTTLRYETYNDNTPATSNGIQQQFIPGVFTQAEFIPANNITLLGGLRVDHHTNHGFVTSPRISVKYAPTDLTTVRAGGGTGFRVVNVFTEDHAALTGSREVVFNENLEPEQSYSITASIEHIIPFGANPLTISLDGFHTQFSNKIIPDYDQDPNLIVYENLDGFSVTQGFSIGVDQNFTSLPINYNTSFTIMEVFTQENNNRRALTYAPSFLANAGITYQLRRINTSISYSASFVGSKRMPDSYVQNFDRGRWSPAYSTHDVKITKEFTNVNDAQGFGFEAYATAENIFNYTQGSPLVDASNPFSPDFDTIYTWGPIVGRTFSLGARINLR